MRFYVWDPLNEPEEHARVIEAINTEAAAEAYAERDVFDGDMELYTGTGHTLHVRADGNAEVVAMHVRVEYEPNLIAYRTR